VSGPEAGLIRRCLAGDEKAYRELVELYQPRIYSLALRMVRRAEDAQDVTQETFIRMFRALERYDLSRPFGAWLFSIASRLAIDHLRRRKLQPIPLTQRDRDDEEYTLDVEDPGPRPEEVTAQHAEEDRARALIDTLPPHYRIVVVLRHQEDLSYEEISAALHLPLGTVKARIHRARALLRERIEKGEA
jgi:RNA polymerase sigma-70 factor (ECF subfamily)